MWIIFLSLIFTRAQAEPIEPVEAPLIMIMNFDSEIDFASEVWFDVAYQARPGGEIIFHEPGERLWWLQNNAVLVLGATGRPLPAEVTDRASVWVHLIADDGREFGPYELSPRRDGVALSADLTDLASKLGSRLAGVDSSYLAQVAHYLVGNLTTLNVIGTSYSVSGYGTVINTSGDWVGGGLATVTGGSSVFVGQDAGAADNGNDNKKVAVGLQALEIAPAGDSSTAVGYQALQNATGYNNVGVGRGALRASSGPQNTAVGTYSLFNDTSGAENTAVGKMSLLNNQTGSFNTAVGTDCLKAQVGVNHVTAIGYQALQANLSEENTAIGSQALLNNTTGMQNTAIGYRAGLSIVTGSSNTAMGYQALTGATGSNNVGVGRAAVANTSGQNNTGVGTYALIANLNGNSNTALGASALTDNQNGSNNTAVGWNSLADFTGSNATSLGSEALLALTTGNNNTALGTQAMKSLTTGANNTGVGNGVLMANINGEFNTALGTQALFSNTGSQNTAIGDQSLKSFTGNRTVAIGNESGSLSGNISAPWFGQWNTFLGRYTQTSSDAINNSTAIGDFATLTASNQVRIGDGAVNSIGGMVGWTTLSDGRFKRNVRENVPGLDFIRQLRPVTYELDRNATRKFLGAGEDQNKPTAQSTLESGFIAQEVEAALNKSGFAFSGIDRPTNEQTAYGLRYGLFVVPLVKAVQEQDTEISALKAEISELKTAISELKSQIQNR